MKGRIIIIIVTLLCFCISSFAQVKVEMQKEGGVYMVPCEVNGLRLKFVFDTGAARVSLSQSMAEFMIENDYLSVDKIHDSGTVTQADGSSFKVYNVTLDKINIGGCVLSNVEAIITPYQNAPLLLGQTAIQKLGRISIKDNYLIIEKDEAAYVGNEKDIAFLGLKLGTDYDTCLETLENKYGEDNILECVVNDAIDELAVEDVYFINQKFDRVGLWFDDYYLSGVELVRTFKMNQLALATKFRDDLFKFLSKKYKAIKSITTKTNFKWYYLGYENKSDVKYYPISITLTTGNLTTQHQGEKPIVSDLYFVRLSYWPNNIKLLKEQHPSQDDY